MLSDIIRLLLSLFIGIFIGAEREKADKPCGIRTISFIILGATLATIITFKFDKNTALINGFDSIRMIAYYLVAICFVGGGIISSYKGQIQGITTASLLLPISVIGFLCGMGEYSLAIIAALLVYFILKLKYITNKLGLTKDENDEA